MAHTPRAPDSLSAPFAIERVFDATRAHVWSAFTDVDHLMRWWGPVGFMMLPSKLDLRPGGAFHYGLRAPDGGRMWGKWVFRDVVAPERLDFVVSFCDEKGNVTRHPLSPEWPLEMLSTTTFGEDAGHTTLSMRAFALNATDAERRTFDAGHESMRLGFTGTWDRLADYLRRL